MLRNILLQWNLGTTTPVVLSMGLGTTCPFQRDVTVTIEVQRRRAEVCTNKVALSIRCLAYVTVTLVVVTRSDCTPLSIHSVPQCHAHLQGDANSSREAPKDAADPDSKASASQPGSSPEGQQGVGCSPVGEADKPLLLTNPTALRRFKFTLQSNELELECQVRLCLGSWTSA